MADTIIVSCDYSDAEPGIYYFGISVDNGVTSTPVVLTPASVVTVERELNPGNWSSDLALTVAPYPMPVDEPVIPRYAIRTTIPAQVANGQERTIRLTVDGVIYGPWVFRFGG